MLFELYEILRDEFGPQGWWPAETPFEVMVGAVLVQNTNWKNTEKAIQNLKDEALLDPHTLYQISDAELAELIRPVGYYRLKAKRLKNLLALLVEQYDGDLDAMFSVSLGQLRDELLAVNGVGPETADSILLYAGGIPSFVVDAYTCRILGRHGVIEPGADYHTVRDLCASAVEEDVELYQDFHAYFVKIGKNYCKKSKPACEQCPLQNWQTIYLDE